MSSSHVYVVVVHIYDTSDDRYYICPSREEALIFASNLVMKDLMDGARCTKSEMKKLKKPLQRLAAWSDSGSSDGRSNYEFCSGSIGLVKITKTKVYRNNKLNGL